MINGISQRFFFPGWVGGVGVTVPAAAGVWVDMPGLRVSVWVGTPVTVSSLPGG